MRLSRIALLASFLVGYAAANAMAGSLAEFHADVARAYASVKNARFYIKTGNAGIAAIELETLRRDWGTVLEKHRESPPDPFAGDTEWKATLASVSRSIDAAIDHGAKGAAKAARAELDAIKDLLWDLRRRNGVSVFTDCLNEFGREMDSYYRFRHAPPDFNDVSEINEFQAQTAVVSYLLRQCMAQAPNDLRQSGEFNRLAGDSLDSLNRMWTTSEAKDVAATVNNLRELMSAKEMLLLRF